ncbi:hypothetical protein DPEC_G00331530 [Dallia pectoralis]|uniref:Uncharacterized protein n=1 Tax=Dallia pectoralis TaxID=75939 RepID=A0ACC2F5T2_DALPE|nr:hypothetical protein DPEC_G00331530 [Dallia pectoralis]
MYTTQRSIQADQTGLPNLTPMVGESGHLVVKRSGSSSALIPGGGDVRSYGTKSKNPERLKAGGPKEIIVVGLRPKQFDASHSVCTMYTTQRSIQADQTGLPNLTPMVGESGHLVVKKSGSSSALIPGGGDVRNYGPMRNEVALRIPKPMVGESGHHVVQRSGPSNALVPGGRDVRGEGRKRKWKSGTGQTPEVGLVGRKRTQQPGPSRTPLPGGGDGQIYRLSSDTREGVIIKPKTVKTPKRAILVPSQLEVRDADPRTPTPVITIIIPFEDKECGICGLMLSSVGKLSIHFARFHPATKLGYQCNRCGKTGKNAHSISCHVPKCVIGSRSQSENGWRCSHCIKSFGKAMGLTQHMRHKHPAHYAETNRVKNLSQNETRSVRQSAKNTKKGGRQAPTQVTTSIMNKIINGLTKHRKPPPPQTVIRERLHEELVGLGSKGGLKLGRLTLSLGRAGRDTTLVNKTAYILINLVRRAGGGMIQRLIRKSDRLGDTMGNLGRKKSNKYRRAQQLFKSDRSKLATVLFDGIGEGSVAPTAAIALAFKNRWDGIDSYQGLGQFRSDSGADNTAFGGLVTAEEVREALTSMKGNSAAGPDGLSKKALLTWDPKGTKMAKIYSIWLTKGSVPSAVKKCRTTLIPKSLDPAVCANVSGWRPLTIGSVIMRVYSKILNNRLSRVCSISPRQRGFISAPGCSENLIVLNGLIAETRQKRLGLAVVFIDFARAFDSVSHNHILDVLSHRGVDEHIIRIIRNCYKGVTTKVAVDGEEGPTINIRIGVKQGDPLSPLLFNLALDPVIATLERGGEGCPLDGKTQVTTLAFADDLVLLSESWEGMCKNLSILEKFLEVTGLKVQPSKCHGFFLETKNGVRLVNPCEPWSIGGKAMHMVGPGESVKYLGTNISPWMGVMQPDLVDKLSNMLEALKSACLKPSQKISMLRLYAMPRLIYGADHGGVGQETLKLLDSMIRSTVKSWLHLPKCTTNGILYSKFCDGGLGITKMACQIPSIQARRLFRLWHSDDEITRRITRRVTKPAEFIKLWIKAGGRKDEVPRLEGTDNNGKARSNLERLDTSETERLESPNVEGGNLSYIKFPDWREKEFLRWMGQEVQGMGIQGFHKDKISNHWLAEPTEAGFRQRHYIAGLLLRANVYPTLETLSRGRPTNTVACRRCGLSAETCSHILGQCNSVKGSRITRHHKLCGLLAGEAERAGWNVIGEMVCRTPSGAQRRPDLVFVKDNKALLVDVTVRYEIAPDTLSLAAREKVARYKPVIPFVLNETGARSARVMGFPLGGRGKWHPANELLLKELGLGPTRRARVARLLSRRVLLYSLDILRDFYRTEH